MPLDQNSLQRYMELFYKPNYAAISENEIYKWRALQRFKSICFLDGGFDSAEPFRSRFVEALASLDNLLDGKNYYAKKCLLDCAKYYPIETKKVLSDFNFNGRQKNHALAAMDVFESDIIRILKNITDKTIYLQSLKGYRAAALLLFFMYPELHFFYKSKEYHAAKKHVGYKPSAELSAYENCQRMSGEILEYVRADRELCAWYEERRKQYKGIDPEYHLLVQDILWSTRYYDQSSPHGGTVSPVSEKKNRRRKIELVSNPSFIPPVIEPKPGNEWDYAYIQQRNAELGLDGERYVMRYETERLRRLFPDDASKRPQHISVEKDNGLGYDIQSFDEKGNPIFIEVKTTSTAYETPFYITEVERIQSGKEKQQYYLYRVYNFHDGAGDIGITAGDLDDFCKKATVYMVILKKQK